MEFIMGSLLIFLMMVVINVFQTIGIYLIWNFIVPILFTVNSITLFQAFIAALLWTLTINTLRGIFKSNVTVKR